MSIYVDAMESMWSKSDANLLFAEIHWRQKPSISLPSKMFSISTHSLLTIVMKTQFSLSFDPRRACSRQFSTPSCEANFRWTNQLLAFRCTQQSCGFEKVEICNQNHKKGFLKGIFIIRFMAFKD